MRQYETTFIIDGLISDDDREAIIKKCENVLTGNGGEITRIVRWGKRQLAYEIKKRNRGYYVIFYYLADPSIISSFHRELDINENILRYMSLCSDGKHPDYIRDEGFTSDMSMDIKEPSVIASTIDEAEEELSDIDIDIEMDGEDIEDELPQESAVDDELSVDSDEKNVGDNEEDYDSDVIKDQDKEDK